MKKSTTKKTVASTTDFEVLLVEIQKYQEQLKKLVFGLDMVIKKLHQCFVIDCLAREAKELKKINGCPHLVEGCADKELQNCLRDVGKGDKALKRSQNPKTACRKTEAVDMYQALRNAMKKFKKGKTLKEREEAGDRLYKAIVRK